MHPEICPACEGEGWIAGHECRGCGGLGWVAVPDGDHFDGQDHALPMFWWMPPEPEEGRPQ